MKKLALIYSGQPRHLRECFENHKKNFYDSNIFGMTRVG